MHLAGSSSWRFAEEDGALLRVALHVRDRAGLPVAAAPDVPPPSGELPPDAGTGDRAAAGEQWLAWWRSLIVAERRARAAHAALDDRPARERRQAIGGVLESAFDPPAFDSLAGSSALRAHVLARFEDTIRRPDPVRRPEAGWFAWATVRDCVEDVAAEHGVPADALRATVTVLPVPGRWSHISAPGDGLCSVAVAQDDAAARSFLRELFASGLPQHDGAGDSSGAPR